MKIYFIGAMQKGSVKRKTRPAQQQSRTGIEAAMRPIPVVDDIVRKPGSLLKGKIALVTGADSGIGKAVAILFAKEGADIAVSYLNEHRDAKDTQRIIEAQYKRKCILLPGDLADKQQTKTLIKQVIKHFGRLDILVNNAAIHYEHQALDELTDRELIHSFDINILAAIRLTRAALPHLKKGSTIINTSSVTAYRGSAALMDYAATKGAIVSFTRSLAANLMKKGIRVNGVAPGPVWTPLIASSFSPKKVASFGTDAPMGRAAQPAEIAPCYLFLASNDAQYMSGQFLHPNGGEIVNG